MIVGDSLIFRNGLRMLLDTEKSLRVISEAANILEATMLINKDKPNVLLINSAELENGEASGFISQACKEISTIILTNASDPLTHKRYLLLGANGVVTKEQSAKVLFKAIEQVQLSDLWFKREVMKQTIEQLIREKTDSPQKRFSDKCAALTDREKEVLANICKGMKNKAIAESLFITETTVRHHLTSIFEKLNVKSRLALAILAFNEGLVEVPPKSNQSVANYL